MNDLKVIRQNDFETIFEQTVEDMRTLGTYRPEFSAIIARYAEMRVQFSILMAQWYEGGCKITEAYTNKAGATNNRKTALYLSVENLRKELTELENLLGLTPSGLKKMGNKDMAKSKKQSKLEGLLNGVN